MASAVSLLTRGYFPRELPPPFTTEDFGALVAGHRQQLPALGNNARTPCVSHNLARPGSLRRPLKIPNPAHHLVVAEEIEAQWPQLVARFRAAHLSVSVPMVRRTILDRAVVPRLSHRVLSRLRARRFVGARYFLHTDINQFYPSIYTHSIPWALHGKAVAKAQMGRTQGDRIDRAFRNQQDGQTIGVPNDGTPRMLSARRPATFDGRVEQAPVVSFRGPSPGRVEDWRGGVQEGESVAVPFG
jgi:hypothetical protein